MRSKGEFAESCLGRERRGGEEKGDDRKGQESSAFKGKKLVNKQETKSNPIMKL